MIARWWFCRLHV